jgi:uncharacterized protein (DUF342 family)
MKLFDSTRMNESYKWLSWKISQEGTYLTVIPENIPEKWDIDEIRRTLVKNKIVSFDIAKIEKVIKMASGQTEHIGEPFEVFEESKRRYIYLQVTPAQVIFSINVGILETDYQITKNDIQFILAEKAVVYGIDHDTIEEILSREIYGREFIIASASLPIAGKDAVITEILPIDPNAKPFLNEDGSVDYKKWDNIRQVNEGEVICTRIPPTPGIPGISVFGQPLSAIPGEDYALPAGINTKAIDDETKLVAAINGFLYRQERDICIGDIYIIKGDVSFKTGNIEYSGDILVRGNVNAGFSVVADGNVSIEGLVESANIVSKTGNVFLKGSVFGLNNARIIAAKNIIAENLQDAKVRAGKTVTVKKQIRNCQIQTENLEMPPNGQILGSIVAYRGYINCGMVGGKSESVNEFILIENEREKLKEELKQENELLQKLNKAIEALQDKLFLIKPPDITPELENMKKLLTSQLESCESSKEQLVAKRKKLLRLIELMPDREALIKIQTLSPILKISIFGVNKELKQELSKLKISWINGATKMEPL